MNADEGLLRGLDLLALAVVLVDHHGHVTQVNQSTEHLLELSRRNLIGIPFGGLFENSEDIASLINEARLEAFALKRLHLTLLRPMRPPLILDAVVQRVEEPGLLAVFELREIDQQLKLDREARQFEQSESNRELVRNLAHEIKNPLGGIRGAAQLLERELPSDELKEYTQVIVKEADRLQVLVDRLLAPHRMPRVEESINIHEVCERVRSLVLAEYPKGLEISRDYDTSIPEFLASKEKLIQTVLNIVQNAAQAGEGQGRIILKTRIARQVTLSKRRHALALDLHIIDHGPGIPEELRDRIFFPLVTGRSGGSGLGLTLAQTFVHQLGGTIECASRPGLTEFKMMLPLRFESGLPGKS